MTSIPTYRFASDAQWTSTLRAQRSIRSGLGPAEGVPEPGIPADALAVAMDGDEIWIVDAAGFLSADGRCGPQMPVNNPDSVAMVLTPDLVWVASAPRLFLLDRLGLQELAELDFPRIAGIAAASEGGVWVLLPDAFVRLDPTGRPVETKPLPAPAAALAGAGGTALLLSANGVSLYAVEAGWRLDFNEVLPRATFDHGAFRGTGLVGGARSILVAGTWSKGGAGLLAIGPDGSVVAQLVWREPPQRLLAALDHAVLAAFAGTPLRFALPQPTGRRLTPALVTESTHGNWLRAVVSAKLTNGAVLTLRFASSSKPDLIGEVERLFADGTLSPAQRMAGIDGLLGWSAPIRYRGEHRDEPAVEQFPFALHAADHGSTLWVQLELDIDGLEQGASILSLDVLHDAGGIIQFLPAIYRGDGDGDGTLRRLVDILDATAQDFDRRINELALRLDPDRTAPANLRGLAEMLGIPFDDALSDEMKRRIVKAAPQLLQGRATLPGLRAMLSALFADRPFRILDQAAELVPLRLGAASLPGVLMGASLRAPRLNARLVLGRTPLCADAEPQIRLAPRVVVTVPATGAERRRFGAAVGQMIAAMLPAGLELDLRWSPWSAGAQAAEAGDVIAVVVAPEDLRLGDGPSLGLGRLAGRRLPMIASDGVVPVRHGLI